MTFRVIREKGIGLLELMLSLAIIAILLIFVTQYYQQTQLNQQINAAIQGVQSAYAACAQANTDLKGASCSMADLVNGGYLNSSYYVASDSSDNPANPFTGILTVSLNTGATSTGGGTAGQYTVTLGNVPSGRACNSIVSKLYSGLSGNQSISMGGSTSVASDGDSAAGALAGCKSGGTLYVNY